MEIRSCMKRKVISSLPDATILAAVQIMVDNHIGTLPVVDNSAHLIGLISMQDIITLAMPDFVQLVDQFDFVHDFGAVEDQNPEFEIFHRPIRQIMAKPVSVEESSGLHRAAALLQKHHLSDLPVVDSDNHLVGIASYVDIGTALMSNWKTPLH